MFDLIEQYQAGVFISSPPLEPNSENIAKLMELYGSKGLIPTTVNEFQLQLTIQPAPVSPISPRPRMQVQMITPDRAWTIAFESHRIMVTRANVVGNEMPTQEDFVATAANYLTAALDKFHYQGTRCVCAMRGLLPHLEEERIQEIRNCLFRLPKYFSDKPTVEWTTRFVARPTVTISDHEEVLNVILDMNRIKGELNLGGNVEPIDRFQVALDINTFQENMTPRFEPPQIHPFLTMASDIAKVLLSQMQEDLHV
ncbi:MAG: hypothetical protein Q7J31_05900 [Syntrophales bacterium]|nr:hypothetical protein [Syntrophales bacterium]